MKLDDLIAGLHPLERAVVPVLSTHDELAAIAHAAKLKDVEAMRALQWLENKGVLTIHTIVSEQAVLAPLGATYAKTALPERTILGALATGPKTQSQLLTLGINEQELNSLIGLLKQHHWIMLTKTKELTITITPAGTSASAAQLPQEKLLTQLPLSLSGLTKEQRELLKQLQRRKDLVKIETHKTKRIELTPLGKKLASAKLGDLDVIDTVTPELLRTGEWKNKTFRTYDVTINVPHVHGGRRHFVNQAIDYAKRIWLDMGFEEMEGTLVNTSFWNFDALFTAQDHPVREMQDTFYIEDPARGKLPNLKLVKTVQDMHEHGGGIESTGWMQKWSRDEATRNVLRTHTTVLSAQTLARLKDATLPLKLFAVGKCFRNEAIDWSHLFEFNQTEGIVIDPNANFRHLLGYLKQFFKKMGFPEARFRPAYFPYTEPSIEIDVYHPGHKKWLELGGAGIFRPEVVIPLLGKDVPVLAWGPGFDRIILDYYKITDIRDLYRNDVEHLRTVKQWMH